MMLVEGRVAIRGDIQDIRKEGDLIVVEVKSKVDAMRMEAANLLLKGELCDIYFSPAYSGFPSPPETLWGIQQTQSWDDVLAILHAHFRAMELTQMEAQEIIHTIQQRVRR